MLNKHNMDKADRIETVLGIRAQLRQNSLLRQSLIETICTNLNIQDSNKKSALMEHLTLALDDEINDSDAHVIL